MPKSIDHILIDGRSKSNLLDIHVRHDVKISTMSTPRIEGMMGHRLVVATLRQKLARHKPKTPAKGLPYNRAALVEDEVKDTMHWTLADADSCESAVQKLIETAHSQMAPSPINLDQIEPEVEPDPLQVATHLLESGKQALFAAATIAAPPIISAPSALDAPESTETTHLREYQLQLTHEWQTFHTENYASAYLKLAFTGFKTIVASRKACLKKTVPKAKQKICVGNHKHSIFIDLQKWAEIPQTQTYENGRRAKLELQEFKQLSDMHWYTVLIARKAVNSAAYNAKINYWEEIAVKLETYDKAGDSRALYQETQKIIKANKRLVDYTLEQEDGTIISNPTDRIKRWTEYHEKLLNPSTTEVPSSDIKSDSKKNEKEEKAYPQLAQSHLLMASITTEDVKRAIKAAKKWRAAGPDEVTAELLLSCQAWSLP
jgi:hypothetical protein